MQQLNRILVPINPQYEPTSAVLMAGELASLFHSEIIPIWVNTDSGWLPWETENSQEVIPKNILDLLQKIQTGGVNVHPILFQVGNPVDRITTIASQYNINVILFGANTSKIDKPLALDPIIEKVIRYTDKPVLTTIIPHLHQFKNLLCPVDFSKASERALTNAFNLARMLKAELTVLFVVPGQEINNVEEANQPGIIDWENKLSSFIREVSVKEVKWNQKILAGDPQSVLSGYIHKVRPDLLIMGSNGKSFIGRLILGSVTESIIRTFPCSFMVTKSEDFIKEKLESKIERIRYHYSRAQNLMEKKLYDQAIGEFMTVLSFNDMHILSLIGLSKAFGLKGNQAKAKEFQSLADNIISKVMSR